MTLQEVDEKPLSWLKEDIDKGGKFVIFTYTISIIVITFKRPSDVYYIPSDGYSFKHGWKYFLISLLLGWWGVPWGPIYTFQSLFYAFRGKNMTTEILDAIIEDHQQSQNENNDVSQDEQSQIDPSQDEQLENSSQNYASQDPFEMADPKNNRVDTDFK